MPESGILTEVRWEWVGSELSADVAMSATSLPVYNSNAYSEGDSVWIGETGPYEVTAVDEDTDTLTIASPGATEAFEEGESVIPDAGSGPAQRWVAEVILADASTPIEVPLRAKDLLSLPEGVYDPPWGVSISDDYERVLDLPNQKPAIDSSFLPASEAVKFEADDAFVTNSGSATLGSVTIPLSHRPIDESLTLVMGGVPQSPSEFTIDYDARTVTADVDAWVPSGIETWVHYAYYNDAYDDPIPYTVIGFNSNEVNYPGLNTTCGLPVGTAVGDIIVFAMLGGFGSGASFAGSTDGRLTEVASGSLGSRPYAIYVGYASTLSAISHSMGGGSNATGQFTTAAVTTLRGTGRPLRWNYGRWATTSVTAGDSGVVPGISGTGSGAFAVVLASGGIGGAYGFDWAETTDYAEIGEAGSYPVVSMGYTMLQTAITDRTNPTDDSGDITTAITIGLA